MKKTNIKKILVTLLIILGVQVLINNYVRADGIVPEQITNTTISSISNYNYSGKEIRPSIRIEQGYRVLVEGTDYTLAYYNNVNVGTASVQITGIGNYTGTITKYFKIDRKPINQLNVKVNNENYTYTGKERKAWVKIYNGNIRLVEGRDYTLKYKNAVKTGKASVEIRLKGNYTGSVKKTYKIVPKKAKIKSVIMNRNNTKATITWNRDKQASGYVIYRATSKNGKYKKIKHISNNKTTEYVNKNLNKKKTYYYKVRSYKMIDKKKAYSKNYSNAKTNTGLISEVTLTSYSSGSNRNTNLKLACEAINGLVLKPGKTFNWFNTVGKATKAKGYKMATVFVNKKNALGLGGGICQVSTTLYQTAKKAKLKMVERHQHSKAVSYTTTGNDATVTYGVNNLRIKNNKKYAVKLVMKAKKGSTTCKIYKVNY